MAHSGTARLDNIPNELLDQIGGYLDQCSLHSLTLVCRHTKQSAYEQLYQSYTNLSVEKPIILFLRTIAYNPDLAAKVKSVTVRNWDAEGVAIDARGYLSEDAVLSMSPTEYNKQLQETMKNLNLGPQDEKLFHHLLQLAQATRLIPTRDWSGAFQLPQHPLLPESSNQYVQFVRSLWNNIEDAYMIFLLSLLPNLEHLEIRGWQTTCARPKLL
ncbi:hypothetical protein K491DRAFT_783188 [Lophiostoma macrostomum CBS 122681]|uniref:F-box domain-containing protein n=1 Tax=Lophiostoma macrostomum CBS 122681 TaxID=1314788 RepID=A0A6A6ST69_9PLEO|nr:hypothetical protein K491DRAFT_783188 [Lophiostoma macrostomum CBS 122681]